MKKTFMALVVSAGVTLAPISPALANTGAAQPEDAIASAWVPATLAEQQAARGGVGSNSGLSPLIGAATTVCYRFNFRIRTNSQSKGYYCGKGEPV